MDVSSPDNRLRSALNEQLRADYGECPLTIGEKASRYVELWHCSGGHDATYVYVSRRLETDADPSRPSEVTIGFAPHVAGTMLIYDVTAGTMQGKAGRFYAT